MLRKTLMALVCLLVCSTATPAGLYYSAEQYASLPTQWRGFLLDHRSLRNIAVKPKDDTEASPLRARYQQEVKALQTRAKKNELTADELADLGALHVRLGEPAQAIEVLRAAQRKHPKHFAIAANLGTA